MLLGFEVDFMCTIVDIICVAVTDVITEEIFLVEPPNVEEDTSTSGTRSNCCCRRVELMALKLIETDAFIMTLSDMFFLFVSEVKFGPSVFCLGICLLSLLGKCGMLVVTSEALGAACMAVTNMFMGEPTMCEDFRVSCSDVEGVSLGTSVSPQLISVKGRKALLMS